MQEPSFSNGFASPWYGGRMKYPDLWKGNVGYWAPLLGPTGATLFDVSGYGLHSALINTPMSAWEVGEKGTVLNCNSSALYGLSTLAYTAEFSISAWCKWSGTNGNYQVLWHHGDSNANGVGALVEVSTSQFTILHGGVAFVIVTEILPTNKWMLITVTRSSAGAYVVYRDTTVIGSGTPSAPLSPTATLYICGNYGVSQQWNGYVSSVARYTRVLAAAEIALLAQRPGIMLELDDSDVWGAIEAGGSVPWWAFANRQSRIIGGGVT